MASSLLRGQSYLTHTAQRAAWAETDDPAFYSTVSHTDTVKRHGPRCRRIDSFGWRVDAVAVGALHVRESYCLTDGRLLALFRTAHSDAPNQVRADFVWLKAVFAFLSARAGPITSSSNGPASETCRHHFNSSIGGGISYESIRNEDLSGRLPAIAEQLPTLAYESRESAEERSDSLEVERWKGYR